MGSDGQRDARTVQTELRCATVGHQRAESTFRTDGDERLTVASCRRCGTRLGAWYHD
jgi:hypothetical protein